MLFTKLRDVVKTSSGKTKTRPRP